MHETTSGPEQAGRALLPVLWLFWLAGLVVNSLLAWKVAGRDRTIRSAELPYSAVEGANH